MTAYRTTHRTLILIIALLAAFCLTGSNAGATQIWATTTDDGGAALKEMSIASSPETSVLSADRTGMVLDILVPGFSLEMQKTRGGEFLALGWPSASPSGAVGAPALPVVRKLFLAPLGAAVTVQVDAGDAILVDADLLGRDFRVMPRQAPVPKLPGAFSSAPFAYDAPAYGASRLPAERAVVSDLGIFRGQRVMLLEVSPLAYNAKDQQIAFWPRMNVSVGFQGETAATTALRPLPGLLNHMLNPGLAGEQSAERGTGNYLVIVTQSLAAHAKMTEFVNAKTAQGFTVSTYSVPPGTSNTAIKAYITGLWGGPGSPDYILLVGDSDTIPGWTGGGEGSPYTDIQYACMDGATDWSPDIAIGRFPVDDGAELTVMVDKILSYDNGQFADASYTSRACFMASVDNYTISEGTHNYVIGNHMDPNGIISDRLYQVTYGATTQDVRDSFNGGRLFGVYSGHGAETYWADGPVFHQSDINGLSNYQMYSWVLSFACITGTYTIDECFMETWVLAADKGAIAAWGSSVNSYWTEDDILERRLFDVLYYDDVRELGPLYNAAKIVYAGEMGTGQTTRRYFEMYNHMGDPATFISYGIAALRVTPSSGLIAEGPEGGPFAPTSKVYTLSNLADYPIDYTVALQNGESWLDLTGSLGGSLNPGATADVTVALNAGADTLPIGAFGDTVVFTNLTDGIGNTTRLVSLEVGRYVYHSADVPQAINDNSTITSTLEVGDHFCIADVDLELDITHTYIGDLTVTLTSPEGTMVTLHNRSGGSSANIQQTYDDEGITPDGPGALSDFDFESPLGTWTLTVTDSAGGDTGTLNAWSVKVLPSGVECPPVALDAEISTTPFTVVDVQLVGSTMTANPLDFIITSLPAHGTLRDGQAVMFGTVPYTLTDPDQWVRFVPAYGYAGDDTFTFITNDGQDSATATVTVHIGDAGPVFTFDLETSPGWSMTGDWAFGVPQGIDGDPTSGCTGSNVYGNNLSGEYTDNMTEISLTTGLIDCTDLVDVNVSFMRWLGVESSSYDHARFQINTAGLLWNTIWENGSSTMDETSWTEQVYDISGYADGVSTVRLRWTLGPTDSSVTYQGWNIDDIVIIATDTSVEPPPDCNENGVPDVQDIIDGTSADSNGNDIPDECEGMTSTIGTTLTCTPDSGVLPFVTQMAVALENLTTENRRAAARINVVIANGTPYTNWRAGWTNLSPSETYNTSWNQSLPGIASLVGSNVFTIIGEDVTPAPYNQPPYAPAGDTANDGCTITASAP
jgi:subtilisin-like proprotein convertase family protein